MTCSLGSASNCGPFRSMEDFLPLRASNTCAVAFASAILLTSLPDLDDRAPAAGHAAAHPELVVLGVHRDDLQVAHRDGLVAHLAGHLLALEDAGRVGRRTHGAGLTDVVRAVGFRTAAEAVSLDGPLKTPAFGGRAHVHFVADLEEVHADRPADLARYTAQLLEVPARGRFEPGEGAGVRLVHPAQLDGSEADLDGVVAVLIGGAHRRHEVRLDLEDGHTHERPIVLEGLAHVLLASENCHCHSR